MDDIKEELATQDPRAYLNSNPQPREWTLSAREMARISTVTPADLALTTEQLSPRKWGPVESFARAIPEGITSPATSIVESIGTADIALTGLGHSSPNMTKEEMTRQLQNAEYLRLYSRKSRAIRDARHEPSEIGTNLGAGVGNLITYALTAGVGGGAALFGLSSAQAAADLEAGLVDKYVSESGDEYLRGYTATDKALDTAAAVGYGVFSGAVESVFGVERLAEGVLLAHAVRRAPAYARRQWMRAATGEITKAQAKRNITGALLGRQAITGMVGEAIEEGIQSVGEDLTMLARGYTEDLSMDEIGKKALVAALYGAVLGGAGGTGLYYLNRRTIINKVNKWQESNKLKLSERETVAIADELLDTGRARVVDEINTRAEVLNGYGRAIDIVAGRIEQQIRSQGWTRSDEDLKKYSQAVAKTLTLPAILSANRAGVPLSEFLKLANLRVVNNVLYMDPINNADDVQNMIKEQQALVSDLNLRAKLDNADKEALTDARRRLALLKTLHKQLLLDEALTDVQLTDEQQARVGKAQKSAAKLGLKSEADFGSAKDSRSARQQKYHDATMAWIANGDNRLLKQLIGGRVPQKITQALTSLSERLRQIQELHPDIDIRGDIVGALKKLENTNKDNFTQTTQLIDPNGRDVMPENVLLYNFLFVDQNTITSFLNNYLDIAQGNRGSVARGESATGDTIAPLSKKDLYAQAFKMTDEQKRQQAIARGAEYESLFSETGEIKDPNLLSAFVSYQNQFAQPVLNQAEFYAADLTEVKEFNKEVNADTVREYITNLIGQLLETGTKPLQVQVIGDHVGHIIKSNKKLNKTQTERQHKALSRLRSILKHAIRIPRDGTVDMGHNTRKSTLEHKAKIQEYIYFAAPVKIGDVFYNVEFTTERMKGQDPNILNLYNVHVKETGDRVSKTDTLSPVSTQSVDKTSQNVKTLNQRKSVNAWYDPELQAIVLGKSYNELSLPHELQHYFLQKTWDLYKKGQAGIIEVNPEWMTETEKLFAMLEIDPSQEALTTVQQERFAAMSEAYLSGLGVQNVDNLTFKEFLNWVPEKYIGLTNIGYLDEKGEIKQPVLDQEAIEFFNKWYGNGDLPTLPVSPEIQQLLNATDAEGAIIPSTQKIMNNREKQWGQESEEQQKADAQLWRAIGENTPGDLRAAIDAEEEVLHNTEFPDDRKMPERQSWFKTGVKDARQRMADIARKYLEKNKEHAESVAYGNPEYVDNDTGVDRGMLIRAVMETVKPNSKEYALLDHNLAIAKSMSASTLSLSGDISHQAYLDALREVESTREMKAAINYAGTRKGALDKWNSDIRSYIDTHMASVLATAPNTKEREIALKAFVEGAKTKFSGNTTNATLNQLDLTGQTTTNKEQFIKWANAKIREDSTAKLSPDEKKTLMVASVKAQAALTAIDSPDKAKAAAAAKDLRHWQFEKNKLMRANIGRFNRLGLAIDNLFGSYAPSAMLMSVNTLFVANIPSSALNNALVKSSMQAYYKNNAVDPKVVEAERERIYTVFKASSLNLAQMEKPTSPSLLHGEKYTTDGQPHWYDFTFKTLAWGDNLFRIPTFVDTLARIATKDANGDSAKATQLFQEYSKLNNQSDAAKLARKQALAVSNMGVFTQDGILAQGLNYIRDQLNVMSRSLLGLDKEGFGLGNLLAPFLKTGANVAEMGGRAAIAPVRGTIYAVKKLAGKEIPDIEKIALRTDWKYFAMTAAITAAYAALTSDDDEWYIEPYESGKKYDPNKPYDSIKIAGGWVKLDVFGPLAIPLRVAAKLTKEKEKGWLDATLSGYSFGGQEFLGDLPLVNTVMDNSLGWAQKQPGQWAQSYAYTQVNKLVPAQLKSLSRAGTRAAGIEAWTEPSESMKSVQRKFHRNYGLDGAQPTTNDYINVITNRLKVWPE